MSKFKFIIIPIILLLIFVFYLSLFFVDETGILKSKAIIDITQALIVILATLFTAQWTSKSYGYKERINALQEVKLIVDEYFNKLVLFYAPLRDTSKMTKEELEKRFITGNAHNITIKKVNASYWIDKKTRDEVVKIVSNWFSNDRFKELIENAERPFDDSERKIKWNKFESEYQEVTKIIEKELNKYK